MPIFNREIETLNPDAMRELQEDRFVKAVKYAYERIPMYSKRFQGNHITPRDIKSLEDVPKVPFTYKDNLR